MKELVFDISKPTQARELAILLAEFQGYGVKFEVSKDSDSNWVTVIL